MPYNLGMELKRDFPHLMRARYEKFGRGGGRGGGRGAPPAIPRSQCITNASAVDRARGEAAREREATAKAEERAEKTRKLLADSELALFKSQEETDAANERIAGLEDQLRRERQQSAQKEHLEREAELRRRSDEARRREAEARASMADANKSAAERERDRLRADLEELKAKEDARDADLARTRANAQVLLGADEDDDVATLGDRVQAFRSAIATMRTALGEKDALSIWDKIYRKVEVGRDTLVENVMTMFGPATATREWTADQMFMRPIRVEFDRCGAVQRSGMEMVPQLTRTLFPSSKELVRFICGDDKLDADKLWSLFTFDEEAYSQTFIDYDHPSGEFGLYTEDDPTMRHLKTVLSEFCDAERLKFFKFVSGLAAIPATRPGEAKPFQLLVDGKEMETNRLPTTSTCYYQLHCPPYTTKDVLKDKLRLAIEAEGFDQK